MTKALSAEAAMSLLDNVDDEAPDAVGAEAAAVEPPKKKKAVPQEPDDAADADEEIGTEAEQSTASEAGDQGEPEEAIAEDDEAGQGEPDLPAIDPPQGLDANEREAFKSLPRAAQEILTRHDKALVASYTQKTQELAGQRKALTKRLEKYGEVATEIEKELGEWQSFDWLAYKKRVSADQYLETQAQYDRTVADYQRAQSAKRQLEAEHLAEHVESQKTRLKDIAPHLTGETGAKRRMELMNTVISTMRAEGYDDEDISYRVPRISAFEMAILDDALNWRAHKAQKAVKPTLKPKPDAKAVGKPIRTIARPASSTPASAGTVKQFTKKPTAKNAMAALDALDID